MAEDNSGLARISEIRVCNSTRVFVGCETLGGTTMGAGVTTDGDASGVAVGDGLGSATAGFCAGVI